MLMGMLGDEVERFFQFLEMLASKFCLRRKNRTEEVENDKITGETPPFLTVLCIYSESVLGSWLWKT